MSHLRHIDLVIGFVGTDPFDPDDALLEIDRHHEAIIIALDVEDDPLRTDDTRRRMTPLDIRRTLPRSLARFVEPSIQCGFHCRLILSTRKALYELPQCAARDDPHSPLV